ncbi:glycosyl hydrolase family 18 protein [Paraflavisolibacter sp. H34]|uniref:glycosyl hydrolase family 18 protein n=1 Tax=Huijunlia imazamoxiresistens TaxID=3127457 RepID=UPI003018DFB2
MRLLKPILALFLAFAGLLCFYPQPWAKGLVRGALQKDSTFPPPELGFKKVGYLFIDSADHAHFPSEILRKKLQYINIVCFANAYIDTGGLIQVGYPASLVRTRALARESGARVFLSVQARPARWNLVTSSAGRQTKFIRSVLGKLRHYQLDGLDIDWEFPGAKTAAAFTGLLRELGDSCHKNGKYYLSAALISGNNAGSLREAVSDSVLKSKGIDFFNIMAYDDLRRSDVLHHHATYEHAEASLRYWIDQRKMPARKAVLGIPFFGYALLYYRDTAKSKTAYDTLLFSKGYDTLVRRGAPPQADSFTFITRFKDSGQVRLRYLYNGKTTVEKKARLARARAGGLMFWELTQDSPYDSTSLLYHIRALNL